MYRVQVGEIEMSTEMLGKEGQNTLTGKQTISKGCKENGKTQGQLKMAQEKISQYEAEKLMQSGMVRKEKESKR